MLVHDMCQLFHILGGEQLADRMVSFNTFVSAKVGAEGMGLLTLVMSVYGLSVTAAASGVNLAAVQLTARALTVSEEENFAGGSARLRRVMRGCVAYSLCFGIGAAILLFLLSEDCHQTRHKVCRLFC